jgi:hypothetical protein
MPAGAFAPQRANGGQQGISSSWLRAARAIMVLEAIDSLESRRVLQTLAGGEPDALPTRVAKSALERSRK